MRIFAFLLVLILTPVTALAQQEPEELLSDTTQIYFRWDGSPAHRKPFNKTASGQLMQEDPGTFLNRLWTLTRDFLESVAQEEAREELLAGAPPEELEHVLKDYNQALRLPALINRRGIVIGFEAAVIPPYGHLMIIIPDAGSEGDALFALMRVRAQSHEVKTHVKKIAGRTVHTMDAIVENRKVFPYWWMEGKHAVLIISTEKAEAVIKRIEKNKKSNVTKNRLYQKVRSFQKYTTSTRAYVDVKGMRGRGLALIPKVKPFVKALGLNELNHVTHVSGFEGKALRSSTEIHTTGKTSGLASLLSGKPIQPKDLPPLPSGLSSWSATSLDLVNAHDELISTISVLLQELEDDSTPAPLLSGFALRAPQFVVEKEKKSDPVKEFKETLEQLDRDLGIKFRDDILGNLSGQMVSYADSPTGGLFKLNRTFLFRVKDADKLQDKLDFAMRNLKAKLGVGLTIKTSQYRNVPLKQIEVHEEGFILVPTYAIYKGWLIVSTYPQPVQEAILRLNGELESVSPADAVKQSMGKLPANITAISMLDHRPGMQRLLGLTQMGAGYLRSADPSIKIDVSIVPSSRMINRKLFPDVSVTTQKGNVIRRESRSALPIPFDMTAIGSYYAIVALLASGF